MSKKKAANFGIEEGARYALNRAAKKAAKSLGLKSTEIVPMTPLTIGVNAEGKKAYFLGDVEFIPSQKKWKVKRY